MSEYSCYDMPHLPFQGFLYCYVAHYRNLLYPFVVRYFRTFSVNSLLSSSASTILSQLIIFSHKRHPFDVKVQINYERHDRIHKKEHFIINN